MWQRGFSGRRKAVSTSQKSKDQNKINQNLDNIELFVIRSIWEDVEHIEQSMCKRKTRTALSALTN